MTDDRTLLQRVETGLWGLIPFAISIVLVIICVLPIGVLALGPVMPLLPLMSVYYWAVHRPELVPFAATGAVGLLQDIVSGTPMGLSALLLLAAHGVVAARNGLFRGRSFAVLWFGFSLIALGATMLAWILVSFYFGAFVAASPAAIQLFLTVALYPAAAWFFGIVRRDVLPPL